MIKYLGSQKKNTVTISGSSNIIFATPSSLEQGIYRIYESTTPEDYITVTWNGAGFKLMTFPNSKFIRQNQSYADKICFYIDTLNLVCKNNYTTSKTLITWLEN